MMGTEPLWAFSSGAQGLDDLALGGGQECLCNPPKGASQPLPWAVLPLELQLPWSRQRCPGLPGGGGP